MRTWLTCLTVLCAAPAPSSSAQEQEVVHVGAERCGSCRLEVSRELVFGDDEGPGIVEDLNSWVRRGPGGEYGEYLLVPGAGSAHRITVFDSLGRFQREVGSRGEGPAEFMDIVEVEALSDGRIAVSDRLNMRLSYWSSRFDLIETRPLRALLGDDALHLPDGSIVTNGRQPTPDHAGRSVQLIDPRGQLARSFGAHGDRYLATDGVEARRVLAMSGDSAFWSAHFTRYEMHLWRPDGELLLTLRGSVGWFPDDPGEPLPGGPSNPRLLSMREHEGVLWMLVAIPDDDWRDAVTPDDEALRGYRIDDYEGYRDAMLHAVDVDTGEILAEHRFDVPAFHFVDERRLSFIEEDRGLVPRVVITSFELIR